MSVSPFCRLCRLGADWLNGRLGVRWHDLQVPGVSRKGAIIWLSSTAMWTLGQVVSNSSIDAYFNSYVANWKVWMGSAGHNVVDMKSRAPLSFFATVTAMQVLSSEREAVDINSGGKHAGDQLSWHSWNTWMRSAKGVTTVAGVKLRAANYLDRYW